MATLHFHVLWVANSFKFLKVENANFLFICIVGNDNDVAKLIKQSSLSIYCIHIL